MFSSMVISVIKTSNVTNECIYMNVFLIKNERKQNEVINNSLLKQRPPVGS